MGYGGGKNLLDIYVDSSKNAEEYEKRKRSINNIKLVMVLVMLISMGFLLAVLGGFVLLIYFGWNSL